MAETHSFNIDEINHSLAAQLDYLLPYFNIDYTKYSGRYALSCPIHDSDKYESACIYPEGCKFFCWTRHCEEDIGFSLFNLFKSLLKKKNQIATIFNG